MTPVQRVSAVRGMLGELEVLARKGVPELTPKQRAIAELVRSAQKELDIVVKALRRKAPRRERMHRQGEDRVWETQGENRVRETQVENRARETQGENRAREMQGEDRVWETLPDGSSRFTQDGEYQAVVALSDVGTFGFIICVPDGDSPNGARVVDSDEGYITRSAARGAARKALNIAVARKLRPQPGLTL